MVRTIVAIIGLLLSSISVVFACSCGPGRDLLTRVHDAEMVFAGRVKQIIPNMDDGGSLYVFQVYKIYKNDNKVNEAEVQVLGGNGGGDCDAWFNKGEESVVFAYRDKETFSYYRSSLCGGNFRYQGEALKELEMLTPEVVDHKWREKEEAELVYEELTAKAADEVISAELTKCNSSVLSQLQGTVKLADYKRTSKRYQWMYGSQSMGFAYEYSRPIPFAGCPKSFFVKVHGRKGVVQRVELADHL